MPEPITPAPRAVIFDMDGTLADTFPLVVSAWNAAMRKHAGRDATAEEVIARFGVPDPVMIRNALPPHLGDEAIEAYHVHYERQHGALAQPFEGITEMLAAIKSCGLLTGVMTGKGRRSAKITLAALAFRTMIPATHAETDHAHAPSNYLRYGRHARRHVSAGGFCMERRDA